MNIALLNDCLRTIAVNGEIAADEWQESFEISPDHFGLANSQGRLYWPDPPDLLEHAFLSDRLRPADMAIFYAVGSTNTELMARAHEGSIHQCLYTAECQLQGRGRRGRTWASPFARNLAFSYGHTTHKPMNDLGGLSLVAGLAVAEVISSLGGAGVHVKWPNDVVVGERKLCGILVELVRKGQSVEVVFGIGINVALDEVARAAIDRAATDLRALGIQSSRSELTVEFVSILQKYLAEYEDSGFEPFIDVFNRMHAFHGKACAIHQGEQIIEGQVEGVDIDGALILSTDKGIRLFHGGEVSLRAS